MEVSGQLMPGCCTPEEGAYGTHRVAGFVGARDGLDTLERR